MLNTITAAGKRRLSRSQGLSRNPLHSRTVLKQVLRNTARNPSRPQPYGPPSYGHSAAERREGVSRRCMFKPAGTLCLGAWLWDGGVASGSAVAAPRAMHAGCLQLLGRRISNRSSPEEKGSEPSADGSSSKRQRIRNCEDEAHLQLSTTKPPEESEMVSSEVKIIQQTSTNPVITPSNPAHNGRVCSTWGNFHFKTFDGDIYHYPGLCNYVFASHCNTPYEEFNIQIRRTLVESVPIIYRITIKLEGVAVELTKDTVLINSNRVQLPYSQAGITIERSSIYVKVVSKADIVFMWNQRDSILLELHEKYANQTCGLCGDFSGIPVYNEFYSNNIRMTALQFGNMQKLDGPTEYCEDPTPSSLDNCTYDFDDICQKTLTSFAFADCNGLVNVSEYIMACREDLCRSEELKNASCICDTIAEYSRQCAHAGGEPLNWRTSKLCPKTCPYNMQYSECSSPCTDTCTNPERSQFCEEHCMDGCFCPQGTVFDDINNSGCISRQQCSCIYNGNTYAPGTSFSEQCYSCTCSGSKWNCEDMSCPGTCSVEGGSHVSTYDKKHYDVYGDCTYVLSKHCEDEIFTILVELRKCGMTSTETCLRTVTLSLNKGQTLVEVKSDGGVFVNSIYTQLPISAANVTIFRPSSFFIIVHTNIGIQVEIQITPIMQMFVRLDPVFKDQTCGLCGNFNNVQTDDFKAISGVVEGTAAAFANTWKTQASCPDIQHIFENPCALSIDNEKYAKHWCGLLTDREGPFADCHYLLSPSTYYMNCMFDTCNCQNSEGCLCASLSSYVRACAARGIQINGWRTNVCSKYTTSCPKSLSYSYNIDSCQPTCRSLSEPDITCKIKFVPVDGCTCINGTYMDESGKCVPADECPCYYRGSPIPLGEVVRENGLVCTCIQGKLNCIGEPDQIPVCESPMFYLDCRNNTAGTTGSECQKSCHTLDMQCYSTQCVSGCVCPSGLVLDGKGGCIPEEECPCIHNGAMYQPGEKINADCNTCVCKNRMWECTKKQCLGTCAVYGDGHYTTFDDQTFSFSGNCEYTLVRNHCGKSDTVNGTFQVITENIPCGSTGTTCSKSIKVFLEHYELILNEERVSVIQRGQGGEVPFTVRYIGMYTVIDTTSGLILMWDKKTSIFIKLSAEFKGRICGLCGNYDGNGINDFTTRSLSVVENVLEFGNSWKVSSTCPDAHFLKDPCSTNPYRKSWSEKQCSIINSNVFAACHSQIEPARYYQACVTDACACDSGGDCDCFCTAVAAYAQACNEVGVCIAWRTPSICPLFCDYYNQQGECEWHYKPCGASCMKTCRNPSGKCLHNLPGLEGCYPNCPPDKPYFHEDQMKCVSLCDCYDNEDGKIYMRDKCQLCECTSEGLQCKFDDKACNCIYENNIYKYNELIYNTTDGSGWCFHATCDVNGTISRNIFECGITTTPSTSFTFSTSQPTTAGTSQPRHTTGTSAVSSSSPTTPSTTEASGTTPCFCHVFGGLFSPGEVVYNRTDKAGCNFYALCSKECEIAPFQGPCPVTTALTSVSSEATTEAPSSTATSLTDLPERNCTDVNPPRKPGERWTKQCEECVCDPHTATAECQLLPCEIEGVVCDVGFIAFPVIPVTDPCCPELECRQRPNTCEINGKIYESGAFVIDSCKNCTCSSEKGKNIVKCEALKCETSCPPGHQYKIEDGECCGKCEVSSCRIHLNNETVLLEVGKILPLDLCSHYKCEIIEDQYVAVQTKRVCPDYGPLECDPDEAETTSDGCCKICKPTNCKAYSTKTVIQYEDCESPEAVELGYCEGTCPGSSMYSLKANQMQHDCSCCQELSSHRRDVILNCQNGTSINYSYVYVDQCQCMNRCNSQSLAADDYQSKISQKQT
ncbi:mucin-5AC-like [Centrocercus urophasianus]|uniref:mucin-5AC-like n=1 Tax=Centrocercus urophasianus TaxID=9002 RepID=UPI001C64514B|nr:mucin-5AC-like [Centrocercus urophasianus]